VHGGLTMHNTGKCYVRITVNRFQVLANSVDAGLHMISFGNLEVSDIDYSHIVIVTITTSG